MDSKKLNKILGGALILALVYIIFLQGCGNRSSDSIVVEVDTVLNETVIDTNWFDTTRYKYITVNIPKYYYDTVNISVDNFDNNEFEVEYASIYEDTIKNDTISLYYRAKVWGFMEELKLGYKIFTPYSIEKITTTKIEVTKKKRFNGIYGGFDVGVSKLGIVHFSPTIEASGQRFSVNIGYDVYDKAFIGGVKTRIRLKRD